MFIGLRQIVSLGTVAMGTVCRNVVTCLCRVQPVLELYMVATLQSLLELYMSIEEGVAFYPYVNKQCIGCMAEDAMVVL